MGKKDPKTLRQYIPDFDTYWDVEKNEGIDPDALSVNASQKVWTKCPICNTSVLRTVRYSWEKDESGVGHIIHCRTCGKRNDKNALVKCFPDIVKYWDYEKNEHVPEYYAVSSGKKVFVKCPECGESKYRALCDTVPLGPDGKYKLSICADCLKLPHIKRRYRKGDRLDECCPGIKDLWIYEKNSALPEELTPFSRETIYIKCPVCGDELKRSCFNSFDKNGDTFSVKLCHKCGMNKGVKEKAMEKPISAVCPECIDWWDYANNELTPDEVSHRSKQETAFICPECNASFVRPLRAFFTVHQDGSYLPVGCPICGYTPRENPEDNLLTLCPEIAEWWDYEKNEHLPEEFTPGSQQYAYLKCPDCNMELFAGIHSHVGTDEDGNVFIRHKGKCRKYKAMESENNLVSNYPEIKDWWDYEKNENPPEEYTLFSRLSAHFKCPECGAEAYKRIVDAFSLVDGAPILFKCPYCRGKKVLTGLNDLKTSHPELMNKWAEAENILMGLSPDKELPNSSNKAWWHCSECDYKYQLPIQKMVIKEKRHHNPCPRCMGRRWNQTHYI